jgi:hypothetical protein
MDNIGGEIWEASYLLFAYILLNYKEKNYLDSRILEIGCGCGVPSIALIELMKKWSGFEPKMWGPTIVGFGSYHYKYASGHEGDSMLIGFSPRKNEFSLYVVAPDKDYSNLLEDLGKYKMGKACIYFKKLSDLNLNALETICKETIQHLSK